MNVFDRYAPFVQDFIYGHGWENLRSIQVAAADAIFNTDENVLLTAQTASGKTEAAFFPILTLFWENPPASVGALYIGPLKALINDQFYRLNGLCEEADIPVWHWHGDVASSHKRKLLKQPSGILQITPESLEALLLHKHSAIGRLFGDLRFSQALDALWTAVRAMNKYVDEQAPWTLAKSGDTERLGTVIRTLLENMYKVAYLIWPVMPASSSTMQAQLGRPQGPLSEAALNDVLHYRMHLRTGLEIASSSNLFPRLEMEKEEAPAKPKKEKKAPAPKAAPA